MRPTTHEIDDRGDHVTERLGFETQAGEAVNGILTRPNADGPFPAILYIHAHGNRYDIGARELLDGRPALQGALGPVLAGSGFVTLAIDLPGFGGRTAQSESALAKARLWRGRSLAGQMLGELASALAWLAAGPMSTRVASERSASRWAPRSATGWPPSIRASPASRIYAASPTSTG